MRITRWAVVDDHPMVRLGLTAMLAGEPDLQRVGEAADGFEALRLIPPAAPDVVLVDLVMPAMDGCATIAALRPQVPRTRLVLMAGQFDAADRQRALAAGADAFVFKSAARDEVLAAVRSPGAGLSAGVPPAAAPPTHPALAPGADLTLRERELLALMARGLSNQEIADRLSIAMPTVKFHVTNILVKLHADNRTAAVLTALRQKLVKLE